MANFGRVGVDLVVGAVVGAASQLAENNDAKRMSEFAAANANKKYSELKKIGNYVSFGVPLIGVLAEVTDFIPITREWTNRMLMYGSVLAGQKAAQLATKKHYRLEYSATELAFPRMPAGRGARQWAPANRAAAPAGPSAYNVMSDTEILV